MKIEDSLITYKKNKNLEEFSSDNSDEKEDSVSSEKCNGNKKLEHVQYEKKQLQLMLANSMTKVEELIKSEMQYKRKYYELVHQIPSSTTTNDKNDQQLKRYAKRSQEYEQMISVLKQQDGKTKKINTSLNDTIRKMESELFEMETDVRRESEEKKKLENLLFCEREGNISVKIQIKRIQLEKNLLEKDKNSEIQRLNKQISQLATQKQLLSTCITKFQTQISQLTKNYSENQTKQMQRKENLCKQVLKTSQQRVSFNKIQQKQMKNQIDFFKKEMADCHENQSIKKNLQKKIEMLEKIINDDKQEKIKFFQQVNRVSKDFSNLEKQNEVLKTSLKKWEKSERSSIHQVQSQSPQKSSKMVSQSQQQAEIFDLKLKKLQSENKNYRLKILELEDRLVNSESGVEKQIQSYSKKLESSLFEKQKLKKESDFNMEISSNKYRAQIQLTKNDLNRVIQERNEERWKLQQKIFLLENKMELMRSENEDVLKQLNQRLKMKEQEISNMKTMTMENNIRARKQFEMEMLGLVNRLEEVVSSNERYARENERLISYESEIYQLRQRAKRVGGISEGVDHLWQVKQTEYYNLNNLLQQMRN